jgi:RNA polymerase sigma factor (sigma-70 family)
LIRETALPVAVFVIGSGRPLGGTANGQVPGRRGVSGRMPAGPASNGERDGERVKSEAVFAAAVELVTSHSASFKRTAARFSLCAHDAEDAYQRSLEILLTKAPNARREELRPWLHTVIKHEALALRRQRERSVSGDEDAAGADAVIAVERGPEEAATGRERVHRTAEALRALKPGEMQCMILKALGYSYEEIAARTGFSWTKVNRSLTEGRRRFFARFGEIASGTACREYEALLSAACDGHADEEDRRQLSAHLAACQGCRAALREYRSAPARLAELLPPAVVLPLLDRAGLWSRINDWFAVTAGERATALGIKFQQSAEVVSAQKTAAVVASTAAIAGGGAAVGKIDLPERHPAHRAEAPAGASAPAPASVAPAGAVVGQQTGPAPRSAEPSTTESDHEPPESAPREFGFEGNTGSAPRRSSTPEPQNEVTAAAKPRPAAGEFSPAGNAGGGGSSGAGEFGP